MVVYANRISAKMQQHLYNAPEISKTTAIIPGVDYFLKHNFRDIILQLLVVYSYASNMVYSEINVAHRSRNALVRSLLSPYGQDGWNLENGGKKSTHTPRQF